MNFEFDYSADSVASVLQNPDALKFIRWFDEMRHLGNIYNDDRPAYDIACKIANTIGFNNYLLRKHSVEELKQYLDDLGEVAVESPVILAEKKVDKPVESADKKCDSTSSGKSHCVLEFNFDTDVTENVMKKVGDIKSSQAKREALKNRKPKV